MNQEVPQNCELTRGSHRKTWPGSCPEWPKVLLLLHWPCWPWTEWQRNGRSINYFNKKFTSSSERFKAWRFPPFKMKTRQIFISRWHAFAISSLDGNKWGCHIQSIQIWNENDPLKEFHLLHCQIFSAFLISKKWNNLSVNNGDWKFKNAKIILAVNYHRNVISTLVAPFQPFQRLNPW